MYCREDERGIEKEIIQVVQGLLKSYNLSVQDVIRLVCQELAIAATKTVIDKIVSAYNSYKGRD